MNNLPFHWDIAMAGFFWWGNIFMAMWSAVTIMSGVRYARGTATSGPLSWMGMIFDEIFGLDTPRLVPSKNQNLSHLKAPCYFCSAPSKYPHGGNSSFVCNHGQLDVLDCTAVSGVGGSNSKFVAGGSKLVDAVQYINTILTGSSTGSVSKGDYDKKRFKFGTPYIPNQTGDAIGYYYTTDTKGQEIPLIPPAIGTNTIPRALASNPGAYGATAGNHGFPTGWNAFVHYNATSASGGSFGAAITPISADGTDYNNPTPTVTFDPTLGFVDTKFPSYGNTAQTNALFVSGPLYDPDKLKYKQFTPSSSLAHPSQWATYQ